jgi:exonuclease III
MPDCAVLGEFRGTTSSRQIADHLSALGLTHQLDTTLANDPTANALLIASRFPLTRLAVDGFLAARVNWLPVLVESPNPFTLVGMYVPNRDKSGIKYDVHDAVVEQLASMRDARGVAVGDTNTGRKGLDEETNFFNGREDAWFDRLAAAGWHDVYRTRFPEAREYSFRSSAGSGFRLDQAFATESLGDFVADIRYDWGGEEPPSDHAAIVMRIAARR